jgi:hypothetical protein
VRGGVHANWLVQNGGFGFPALAADNFPHLRDWFKVRKTPSWPRSWANSSPL